MKKNSMTGKVKGKINKNVKKKNCIRIFAGHICSFFVGKKPVVNTPVPTEEAIRIDRLPICQIKVAGMSDLDYIVSLVEQGYAVVTDLARLNNEERRAFLCELKVSLWENEKEYIEVNSTGIICLPVLFDLVNDFPRRNQKIKQK